MPHLSTKKMIMICCHPERRFLSSLGSWRNTLNHSFCFIWNDGCLCSSFLFWERKYLFFLRPQLIDDFLIVKKTLISCFISLIHDAFHNISLQLMESHELESSEIRRVFLTLQSRIHFVFLLQKQLMLWRLAWRTTMNQTNLHRKLNWL